MNPNQLLNQHLDNVAVSLRRTKPFTPNDFPAVRRIEQEIRDLPIEHGYGFDSTGMPISHDIGVEDAVDPINFRQALTDSYELDMGEVFDAPPAVFTHNHPNRNSPLSTGDLDYATTFRLPIRAVATDGAEYRNIGQVTEFNPGSAEKQKLFEAIEDNIIVYPGHTENIPRGNRSINHQGVVNAIEREDYQRRKKGLPGYSQLPSYEIHDMEPYAAAAANFPTMASDSFAIGRRTAPAPVVNVATQTAVDPNAWLSDRNATINKVYRQAQTDENLQYELDYRQAMGDRYSHYGY